MIRTLPRVAHEHHERLMGQVDRMPALGDLVGTASPAELRPLVDDAVKFLTGLLIPHMEAAERTLYPELERMLQNRHSMTPMRREHTEIRQLVDELVLVRTHLDKDRLTTGETLALRRVVFRLYYLLKVHLAEELLYVDIVESGVSADAAEALAAAMKHGDGEEA
ncbi:MAG: hemerythrin domain-containing protein [Candidatus Limnocylindrales bacterium]